jgi:hypothetical protein
MCATCGCDGDGQAAPLNRQTGEAAGIAAIGADEHEHLHADGTPEISARTGTGLPAWLDRVRAEAVASRQFSMR